MPAPNQADPAGRTPAGHRSPGQSCRRLHLVLIAGGFEIVTGFKSFRTTDGNLDAVGRLGVLPEELLCVLAALPDPLAIVGVPGSRLLDDLVFHTQIQHLAELGDAFSVHDVEFHSLERRCHFCS